MVYFADDEKGYDDDSIDERGLRQARVSADGTHRYVIGWAPGQDLAEVQTYDISVEYVLEFVVHGRSLLALKNRQGEVRN